MKIPKGFNYSGVIPTPHSMGVSGKGSMAQMRYNVNALLNYGTVLSDGCNEVAREKGLCGGGRELEAAAALAKVDKAKLKDGFRNLKEGYTPAIYPLGDKYFLKTTAKCKDLEGKKQDRYIYINNVPTGKIRLGFGTVGGGGPGAMRGLIPSLVEDMAKLNPLELMRAFVPGDSKCKEVNFETINSNGGKSREKHYMTLDDIIDLDPFVGSRGEFVKFNEKLRTGSEDTLVPSAKIDKLENMYIFAFSVFVIYLISKMAYK